MSRLRELIAELCPDGVEYKALGELLDYEQPGKYIVASTDYSDEYSVPVLTAGKGLLLGYTDETEGVYVASDDDPVIIFDDFTTSFHWITYNFKVKSSAMKMLRPTPDCSYCMFRYAYYAMKNIDYAPESHTRQWIGTYSAFRIPVPPLEVQREIVRILDEYTAAHDELVRKLEEEMELRGQQLSIARNEMCMKEEWPLEAIGNVFTTITGGTPKKSNTDYYGDNHPFYKPGDLVHGTVVSSAEDGLTDEGLASTRSVPPSSILMTCIGSIGKAAMVSVLGSCNQQINAVLPRDGVNMSFYLHVLCSDYFQKQVMTRGSFGNMPILSRGKFDKLLVPVPPLDVQDKVASVLDGLSGAINESLSLLREELSIQEQSLSGVRNELLSFPEKVA
ncbi:MAG: restriction endonuclease subunit S [Aeriscardovia sp.]|nr:restriction endonuclease subunit S [Aeriscardovia sp.]